MRGQRILRCPTGVESSSQAATVLGLAAMRGSREDKPPLNIQKETVIGKFKTISKLDARPERRHGNWCTGGGDCIYADGRRKPSGASANVPNNSRFHRQTGWGMAVCRCDDR